MIPAYQKKTTVAGAVCVAAILGAIVCGALFEPKQGTFAAVLTSALSATSGTAFLYAAWCHIKAKGRSGWWMLVLVFNLLGILILALLKDRTLGAPQPQTAHVETVTPRKSRLGAALNQLDGWQRIALTLSLVWIFAVAAYSAYEYVNAGSGTRYFIEMVRVDGKPFSSPLTFEDFVQTPRLKIGFLFVAITAPLVFLWVLAEAIPIARKWTTALARWIAAGFRKNSQ